MSKRVYIDVGANDGSSLIHFVKRRNNIIYAFEPTPRMIAIIKSKTKNYKNYILIPKAVSNYNGTSKFNISGQGDWGCSSLSNFNDNLLETWPERTDFKVTETIDVEVIKLKDFVIKNKIKSIEYLHVDAQGHDLEVLMGLEDYIRIVKSGVIEMPISHEKKLYKDQKYIVDDAIKYLEMNGFKIIDKKWNDEYENEMNIYFSK
jgi:FkbM family methyltransferase